MAFGKKRKDPFSEIQACLQKRDYKGALDWFNTLLQKDRKNTQIRLRFADTLVLAGSKSEAVKQYRVVADELADKGFMIRAIAINKKILQLDPSQTDVHQKLAAMNEERSTAQTARPALADLLHRPDAPFQRSEDVPAKTPTPAPAPASPPASPPPAREEPPVSLPELSLEESMAMEFGTAGDVSERVEAEEPITAPPLAEEPIPAPPPAEEPEPAQLSGGFELVDVDESASSLEPPNFVEEPMEFDESAASSDSGDDGAIEIVAETTESEVELAFDGLEGDSDASPEIVLDVVEAEAPPDDVVEDIVEPSEPQPSEPQPSEPDTGEIEVIAFDVETEPAMAAEGPESLIGALGEDIDSLIDSIIDDVGSSAMGQAESETPAPTHIPLFSDLTSSEFIDVAILLVRRVAKMGETIVREGDPGDSMFIVSTGEVRATIEREGKQISVATMKDGDFFGEMAVLSGELRSATCTAVKSTELLELSREHLNAICSRHPHVEAKIRLAYDERVARYQPR